jgi:hypothetical protein
MRAKQADSISQWLSLISVSPAHAFSDVVLLTFLCSQVVGLYIEQICLACLFFLKTKIARVSSVIEGALMLVLLVITICAQLYIHKSFDRESFLAAFPVQSPLVC